MRNRVIIVLYVAAALTVSCRREALAPPKTATAQDLAKARVNTVIATEKGVFIDNSRLGTLVGSDGMVAEDKTAFARDEQVYLSMWFRESPSGLAASVKVEDASGKEVGAERKPMNGQKNVTFAVGDKRLEPGKYQVTGYWGGNIAAEYDLTVEDRRVAKPAKRKAKAKSQK